MKMDEMWLPAVFAGGYAVIGIAAMMWSLGRAERRGANLDNEWVAISAAVHVFGWPVSVPAELCLDL